MGQLDCGAKTNVCQAKTYQNHGEQRSLTRAYYYHITFVARLSSRKAFINRRLGCGGAVVRALASHQCEEQSFANIVQSSPDKMSFKMKLIPTERQAT